MPKEIGLSINQTDEIQDPRVHLPMRTPGEEISEIAGYFDNVDAEAANPATGGDTGYEFAPIVFADALASSENPWSFARLYRQLIITAICSLYSIAISIGRYVDDSIKKKYKQYYLHVEQYPELSTTVVNGGIKRYMPLGWYAFTYEIPVPGFDPIICIGPITFIYTIDCVAFAMDPRYSGIHIEPSPGVDIVLTEL